MKNLDPISLLVTCSPQLRLGRIEKQLNQKGFTLGYKPASGKNLTLQRALDRRIPNLYALRYGEIDDICVSLKVQVKKANGAGSPSTIITTKNVPRAATGPDFKKIFIGSKGCYGKILEGVFRIAPFRPRRKRFRMTWKNAAQKGVFLKRFWSSGIRPLSVQVRSPRSLLIEIGGEDVIVREERKCLKKYLKETGGTVARS